MNEGFFYAAHNAHNSIMLIQFCYSRNSQYKPGSIMFLGTARRCVTNQPGDFRNMFRNFAIAAAAATVFGVGFVGVPQDVNAPSVFTTSQAEAKFGRRIKRAAKRAGRGIGRVGRTVGRGIKRAGRTVGRGVKRAARRTGRGLRKGLVAVGRGTIRAGRAVNELGKRSRRATRKFVRGRARTIGRGVKKAAQGLGRGLRRITTTRRARTANAAPRTRPNIDAIKRKLRRINNNRPRRH